MSHLTTIKSKTKLSDREALIKALEKLGITYQVLDNPRKITNFYGSNTDFFSDLIIPPELNKLYSEAAYVWNEEKQEYVLHCDSMDTSFINRCKGIGLAYNQARVESTIQEMSQEKGEAEINWINFEDGSARAEVQFQGELQTTNYGGL